MTDSITSIASIATDSLSDSAFSDIPDTNTLWNIPVSGMPQIATEPVANAFVSSNLELPTEPYAIVGNTNDSSLAEDIAAAISLLIILILFKKIVNIVPSLFACILRWKENINLEDSVRMSRDRSLVSAAMFIPFCLIAENFGLYEPNYMQDLSNDLRMAATACTFIAYFALKTIAAVICRPNGKKANTYVAGYKSSWSFFIIMTLLLLFIAGTTRLTGISYESAKITMLWLSVAIYSILLLREFQIFASSCSYVTAFLYLCALEIVPSGLLVGSVYVF